MSDFISDFWGYYISIITLFSILGCAWLLWVTGRKPAASSTAQPADAPVETTGHVWDEDLQELNNPLPGWWAGLFVITIVFGLVYLAVYPGLGSYAGQFKWTEVNQYKAEEQAARAAVAPLYKQFAGLTPEQLAGNAQAMSVGERLFMNNCAQCHGSDAHGSKGFPNLSDNDWLFGGSPETIKETITKGRNGTMPSMAAAVGSTQDVENVANYVLSLSNSGGDSVKAALGREKFATVCFACHGPDGKGNQALGAPNLTDSIWLFGFGADKIIEAIDNGHVSVMPAHESKLSEAQIRVLAAYVWQLSKPGVTPPIANAANTTNSADSTVGKQ